jgi:Domain of unknown function (DUF6542)
MPWWAAAVVAVVLTAIGVAFDAGSGNQALGGVFATCYVLGCLAAVLAVRQSGVFTAVIQPPLILFVAVPFAYFVFHGSAFTGVKDTLINYGYPLIERFPLMFFTSATVLLIGMIRWYLGAAARRATPNEGEPTTDAPEEVAPAKSADAATKTRRSTRSKTARSTRSTAAASAAVAADAMEDEAPRTTSRRTPRTGATGSQRPTGASTGTGSRRSRHARPPKTEIIEPVQDRPRRRNTPPVDSPDEPRRRPRAREPRDPRERRPRPPLDRKGTQDRDRPERERYDRPQRRERPDASERTERPERPERRRPRSADYEPYDPPSSSRTNGSGGTHHPVSRVRYRGAEDDDSRTEHRTKPRQPRHSAPDSWE